MRLQHISPCFKAGPRGVIVRSLVEKGLHFPSEVSSLQISRVLLGV